MKRKHLLVIICLTMITIILFTGCTKNNNSNSSEQKDNIYNINVAPDQSGDEPIIPEKPNEDGKNYQDLD